MIAATQAPPAAAAEGESLDAQLSNLDGLSATFARADDAALLTAPRPRQPVNASLITAFQTGHGYANFNATAATVTDDTSDYLMGTQSLKVTTRTDNTAASVQRGGQTVDTTGKMLRILLKVEDLTNLTEIAVYAGNDSMTSYYQWTLANGDVTGTQHFMKAGEWAWITLGFHDPGVVGTPTRSSLTMIRLRARATTGTSITIRYGGIALVDEPTAYPNGVVSFTYDDSYLSHYVEARKALDKYGWVGTFYTICDVVGSGAGWMSLAQLVALQKAGHEIAAHAHTLADHQTGYAAMDDATLAGSLRGMRAWLTDNGFNGGDHLAYPQGLYTPATLNVVNRYHASARTVNRRTLETLRPADALRLRSFSVSKSDAVATLQAKVDAAKANKGWLVLTFHDLVAAPTVANHYSIAQHQAIVDYCAAQGVAVLPVGEVLRTGA